MSTIARVLLRKENRLYLNDGMYGAFWELRFKGHVRYPALAYRGHEALTGNLHSFRLFGPTCDSSDEMPGSVELPADIDVGDYIEFGSMGAYSLSGRTNFNGFYSDDVVSITSDTCPGLAAPTKSRISWPSRVSSALQTLGFWVFELVAIDSAMSRSAPAWTYTWQIPS